MLNTITICIFGALVATRVQAQPAIGLSQLEQPLKCTVDIYNAHVDASNCQNFTNPCHLACENGWVGRGNNAVECKPRPTAITGYQIYDNNSTLPGIGLYASKIHVTTSIRASAGFFVNTGGKPNKLIVGIINDIKGVPDDPSQMIGYKYFDSVNTTDYQKTSSPIYPNPVYPTASNTVGKMLDVSNLPQTSSEPLVLPPGVYWMLYWLANTENPVVPISKYTLPVSRTKESFRETTHWTEYGWAPITQDYALAMTLNADNLVDTTDFFFCEKPL